MRALQLREYGPVDSHSIIDIPEPSLTADSVLIENHAIGLNYPDALMLMGRYQKRPEPPFVPGRDLAGQVLALGENVDHVQVGDRVVAQVFSGAFAELVAAPKERVFPLPAGVNFDDAAAAITVFNTAFVATVQRGQVDKGSTVLITGGGGGVGLASIQLCREKGAYVLAAVSAKDKADLCLQNGADDVLFTSGLGATELKEYFRQKVRELNAGKGANLVIDTVGGDTFTAGLRALEFGGRLVIVGFSSGTISEVRGNYLLYNGLSVVGAPLDINFEKSLDEIRGATKWWLNLLADGKLCTNITERHSLDRLGPALKRLTDRQAKGKIVVNLR